MSVDQFEIQAARTWAIFFQKLAQFKDFEGNISTTDSVQNAQGLIRVAYDRLEQTRAMCVQEQHQSVSPGFIGDEDYQIVIQRIDSYLMQLRHQSNYLKHMISHSSIGGGYLQNSTDRYTQVDYNRLNDTSEFETVEDGDMRSWYQKKRWIATAGFVMAIAVLSSLPDETRTETNSPEPASVTTVTPSTLQEVTITLNPRVTALPVQRFANCSEVRAAGRAPIYRNDPSFESKFDRDNDGIGCE